MSKTRHLPVFKRTFQAEKNGKIIHLTIIDFITQYMNAPRSSKRVEKEGGGYFSLLQAFSAVLGVFRKPSPKEKEKVTMLMWVLLTLATTNKKSPFELHPGMAEILGTIVCGFVRAPK